MSDPIDLSQRLEQLYATGDMVGIVLTPKAIQDLTAERDRLREEVSQLRKQLEEAQRQIALLEQDWQSMFRLLPRELQVTEEDIAEAQRNGIPLEKIIQELEQM
jgi:predicted  nucleic acid-binding Zn-ribbon protein